MSAHSSIGLFPAGEDQQCQMNFGHLPRQINPKLPHSEKLHDVDSFLVMISNAWNNRKPPGTLELLLKERHKTSMPVLAQNPGSPAVKAAVQGERRGTLELSALCITRLTLALDEDRFSM